MVKDVPFTDYSKFYLIFSLDDQTREVIQRHWPARFSQVRGDHVTIIRELTEELYLSFLTLHGETPVFHLFGWLIGREIECFRVFLDGSDIRPDGQRYHLTHSFSPGMRAVDSNKLLSGELPISQYRSAALQLKGRVKLVEK